VIDFRNVLAHGYDTVDHESVWSYIHNDLPDLRQQVAALLRQAESPADTTSGPDDVAQS